MLKVVYTLLLMIASVARADVVITPEFPVNCSLDGAQYVSFLHKKTLFETSKKIGLELKVRFGACAGNVYRYKKILYKKGVVNFVYEQGIPAWADGEFPVRVITESTETKTAKVMIVVDKNVLGDELLTMKLQSEGDGLYYRYDFESVLAHKDGLIDPKSF